MHEWQKRRWQRLGRPDRCEAVTRGGYRCSIYAATTRNGRGVCHLHATSYDEWIEHGGEDAARSRLFGEAAAASG